MDDLLTLGSRHIVGCEAHLPLTHVQVCFETSPVCDPPGLEGLTCLTNRLLLEGTVQRTRHDFHAQVEILGTEVISATQASWVSLGGTILSIHRDRFMDLLTEAMTQPRFHLDDLERIRREMMSEIELLGDEDGYLARYWLKNAVFQNTPLLNHPLGRKDTLANIAISDVHQRHCETYTQSRLWLGLSTNMATAEAGQLCRDWATRLPRGTPFTQPTIRPQAWKARNVLLVNKPARSQAQLMIGHAIDHLEIEDKWHLKIAIDAFGGAFSSRLVQALRVQRSLCYDPYAYLSTDRLGGLFLMGASTDGTRLTEAIEVMLNEFEAFRTGGLLADEIELARLARLNSFLLRSKRAR